MFVNGSMAAMAKGLELAEILGHCRGAFTTAISDRPGLLAQADRGTAFLDELGRASLEAQSALLGFLDHGRVRPIGGMRELSLDVRLILATNADLDRLVDEGTLIPDLVDRIGYHVITLKPLRERRSEILPLTRQFLERESAVIGRATPPLLPPDIGKTLQSAPWPGNIRDLVKLCEYVAGSAGDVLAWDDLPPNFRAALDHGVRNDEPFAVRALRAVEACGGNKTQAARRLGKSRGYLYRVLKESRS
jgi:two-component system, NtrC family, response regulator HydG